MTTLFSVLKNAYLSLGQLEISNATGGSTSTVVDTKLIDYGDDDLLNSTIFILRDNGGAGTAPENEARTVTANEQANQTITVAPVFSAAVAAGDTFGIAKSVYPLYTLIEIVNRALANLGTIQYVSTAISTITDTTLYTLPLPLKYKVVKVEVADADADEFHQVYDYSIVPSGPGATGLLRLPFLTAGRTLKVWYEIEHPTVSNMTDVISETIHSELINALVVEKALQWQNDRQSGQDAYTLQRLNKAAVDRDEAMRRFSPPKVRSVKLISTLSEADPCLLV
jgi:hypothetical protein